MHSYSIKVKSIRCFKSSFDKKVASWTSVLGFEKFLPCDGAGFEDYLQQLQLLFLHC